MEEWVLRRREGGWLVVNGSYSSGCSSVLCLSSRPLSSSRGLAMSSSPLAAPSPHCPNMESYKGKQTWLCFGLFVVCSFPHPFTLKATVKWAIMSSCFNKRRGLFIPSSRQGGGHRGGLWGRAPDLLSIRTGRWRRRGGQDACVASHGIIWVHCRFRGEKNHCKWKLCLKNI